MDYQINETILYGVQICRIKSVEELSLSGEKKLYYVLQPVFHDSSIIYVPTNSRTLMSRMRRVLSAEEIRTLIHSISENEMEWIDNENKRKESCRMILVSGDRRALVGLIRTFSQKKKEQEAARKKFRASDDRILKEAERILYDEFAAVLNIRQEEVLPFILAELHAAENQ
ncbi:MAG: CarD family transcriptional regulator [Ruminococcaceae bacterium]|nr:CarD family transcriptional regulator [Oscillospiraceae bacterium]